MVIRFVLFSAACYTLTLYHIVAANSDMIAISGFAHAAPLNERMVKQAADEKHLKPETLKGLMNGHPLAGNARRLLFIETLDAKYSPKSRGCRTVLVQRTLFPNFLQHRTGVRRNFLA